MNVLEKILEEINERFVEIRKTDNDCKIHAEDNMNFESMKYFQNLMFATDRAKSIVEEIIRSHMDEKEKVLSAEIISRNIDGKPYYEIKYKKVGEDNYTVGYSSHKLDYVVNWLNEYFEFCGEAKVSVSDGKDIDVPSNDGWIPVEERSPNQNGVYNVTRLIDDAFISDSAYFDGQDTWHNDNRVNHARPYLTDIVAWQNLPTRYIPPVISKQAQDLRDRESFFTE